MKKWSVFFVLTFALIYIAPVKADSPLTSTPFFKAYMDIPEVKYARENNLDIKLLEFLTSSKTSSIEKIAVINALSYGNKDYVILFENHLLKNIKGLNKDVFSYLRIVSDDKPVENDQTKLLSADDLMCWAYLQTMGDYFQPVMGMRAGYFGCARDNNNSMSHSVVWTLIAAQKAFDYDWCRVYTIPKKMLDETTYTINILKPEAVKIILDYTNLYAGDCK